MPFFYFIFLSFSRSPKHSEICYSNNSHFFFFFLEIFAVQRSHSREVENFFFFEMKFGGEGGEKNTKHKKAKKIKE